MHRLSTFLLVGVAVVCNRPADAEIIAAGSVAVVTPSATSAADQAARYNFPYRQLFHQAITNDNAARGCFALAAGELFDTQGLREYATDLHGLLDQLGEDRFVTILQSTSERVRHAVLTNFATEAGYDEPESDTSDFARFYPRLDSLIRNMHRETSEPAHAEQVSLPAAAAASGTRPADFDKQEALATIAGLAEVQNYAKRLIAGSHGEVKATIRCEDNLDPASPQLQIYVGEDHADHTICWARFRVDPATHTVQIYPESSDAGWVSLTTWRKSSSPRGADAQASVAQ